MCATGPSAAAAVVLRVNAAPTVSLTTPTNNQVFAVGDNIDFEATFDRFWVVLAHVISLRGSTPPQDWKVGLLLLSFLLLFFAVSGVPQPRASQVKNSNFKKSLLGT